MTEGCESFGVKQSHIDWLKSLEVQPRTPAEDLKKFEVPEGVPYMSFEEASKGNGEGDAPFYSIINGKVIKNTWPN